MRRLADRDAAGELQRREIEDGDAAQETLRLLVESFEAPAVGLLRERHALQVWAALHGVISLAEQGLPGFSALAWWGIFAPAGTPKPIIDKLHAELVKILKMPDVHKTLTETLGMDIQASSPEATQKFLVGEMARWGKVVKDNDIKQD